MRYHGKKMCFWCLLSAILVSSFISFLPVFAQDEAIPFVVGKESGPVKLEPLDAYDSESMDTIMQVCEGLYMYNYDSSEMESIPCLAASMGSWDLTRTQLTLPLKEDVSFHDGTHFNSSAVKWNFDRIQYWTYGFDLDGDDELEVHPLGAASRSLFAINGTPILNRTEIIDEYTIRFHLNLPCSIWEKLLAFVACSMVLPDADYAYGNTFFNRIDINDELIGTGPFILTEYTFDEQVLFDYNPDYHMTWGTDHIEQMIYLIVPDDTARSLAILNHEIHWGGVEEEYLDEFQADSALIQVPRKTSIVSFFGMNLYTMQKDYRLASSYAWNYENFLENISKGDHYELQTPIPEGMEFYHTNFDGEPEFDIETAQSILLNSKDPEIQANLTAVGLNSTNSTLQWRLIAESTKPLAEFNFTRYNSAHVEKCAFLLQDCLKNIGIKLKILDSLEWKDWVEINLDNGTNHNKLCYSYGEKSPDFNDPINMIESLYGSNASGNYFGLSNGSWNSKLLSTYTLTGNSRRDMFYEIQEEFCTEHVPSFYIYQVGSYISFNRKYVREASTQDLKNPMGRLYWFRIKFEWRPLPLGELSPTTVLIYLGIIGGMFGIIVMFTVVDIIVSRKTSI